MKRKLLPGGKNPNLRRTSACLWLCPLTLLVQLSCVTSLKTVDVASIQCSLLGPATESVVVALVPGSPYLARITVTDSHGKVIRNPAPTELSISSPNATFKWIWHRLDGWRLAAVDTPLFALAGGRFAIEIRVKDNAYAGSLFTWTVDWKKYAPSIRYDGSDGKAGAKGPAGAGRFALAGSSGGVGTQGVRGEDGRPIDLIVALYDVSRRRPEGISDDRMLLLFEINRRYLWIAAKSKIAVDASGGNGGRGGEGGDGEICHKGRETAASRSRRSGFDA